MSNSDINFPEKCVVCGEVCSNEEIEIEGVNDYEGYSERWKCVFNSKPKLKVPMHEYCHNLIQSKESLRNKVNIGITLASFTVIYSTTKKFDRWNIILALLPVAIINFFLKKYFFITYFSFSKNQYRYQFEFSNVNIAKEFKQLNIDELYDVGRLIDINLKKL